MHADDSAAGRPTSPPTASPLTPPVSSGAVPPSAGGDETPSSSPPAPAWQPPGGGWTVPDPGSTGAPTERVPPVQVPPAYALPTSTASMGGPPQGPPQGPPSIGGDPGAEVSRPDRSKRGGGIKAALVGGLVGAIVAGGVTAAALTIADDDPASPVASPASLPNRDSSSISGEELDIRALLEKVQPSVVSIHTGTRQGDAAGSGIVLDEDGLVLTNAHVIDGANRIEVDFADGQSAEARVIGTATNSDVALVRASGLDGPTVPAELGSSGDLLVGDEVVAIGNALNLGAEPSVTTGIVSQTGRSISAPDGTVLDELIQTDAAINPGNSGGPLINAAGQVVGVNTAILADAQNIGFALEIDSIRDLITDLQEGLDAEKERAVLGVATLDVAQLDFDVADRFSVQATAGAFIQDVTSGSGADVAGLQAGDVILEVDDRRIRTSEDVGQAVRSMEPGEEITLVIERSGEELSVTATLGSN